MGLGGIHAIVRDYSQIRLLEGTIMREKREDQGENPGECPHFAITKCVKLPTFYPLYPSTLLLLLRKHTPPFQRLPLHMVSGFLLSYLLNHLVFSTVPSLLHQWVPPPYWIIPVFIQRIPVSLLLKYASLDPSLPLPHAYSPFYVLYS